MVFTFYQVNASYHCWKAEKGYNYKTLEEEEVIKMKYGPHRTL